MPAVLIGLAPAFGNAQKSTGPPVGTLIVDGGAATNPVVTRFVELAGGVRSRIVAIPTGASSIRFGPENVILDLDWPRDRKEWRDYEAYLENWFGVEDIVILHTRDRSEADAVHFVEPLNAATGVFLAPGNSGRYAAAYLGTGTQKELLALLERGGVIFGSSAGRDYSRFFPRARPA